MISFGFHNNYYKSTGDLISNNNIFDLHFVVIIGLPTQKKTAFKLNLNYFRFALKSQQQQILTCYLESHVRLANNSRRNHVNEFLQSPPRPCFLQQHLVDCWLTSRKLLLSMIQFSARFYSTKTQQRKCQINIANYSIKRNKNDTITKVEMLV